MSESPTGAPVPRDSDPSHLTTQQLLLATSNLEKLTEAVHTGDIRVIGVQIESIRREMAMGEAHRLELKADSEKTVSTAMTAAEKAVQAALSAAEKAREQQTAGAQLATNKSESAMVEQMKQQNITFAAAIAAVIDTLNDVKERLTRTEGNTAGAQQGRVAQREISNTLIAALVGIAVIVNMGVGIFVAMKP